MRNVFQILTDAFEIQLIKEGFIHFIITVDIFNTTFYLFVRNMVWEVILKVSLKLEESNRSLKEKSIREESVGHLGWCNG